MTSDATWEEYFGCITCSNDVLTSVV